MSSDVQRFFLGRVQESGGNNEWSYKFIKIIFVSHDGTRPRLNLIQNPGVCALETHILVFSKQKPYFLKSLKEQSCSSKSMMIFSYIGDCCFGLRKVKTYWIFMYLCNLVLLLLGSRCCWTQNHDLFSLQIGTLVMEVSHRLYFWRLCAFGKWKFWASVKNLKSKIPNSWNA